MKKILLLLLIFISSTNLWSQTNYEIDSIILVNIPGKIIKIDTLINETIKFQSKVGNSNFSAKRKLFENDSISIFDSELPYDSESLEKYYETLANDYTKNTNLKIESKELIKKNSFKGYHLKLTDSKNNSIYEIEYFLLNKKVYLFSHRNTTESNKIENDNYFNSITINSDKEIYQFSGKSPFEKSAYNLGYKFGYTLAKNPSFLWIAGGLFLFLVIGVIIYFVRRK